MQGTRRNNSNQIYISGGPKQPDAISKAYKAHWGSALACWSCLKGNFWTGKNKWSLPAQLSFNINTVEHGPDPSLTFHQLHTSHSYWTVFLWIKAISYQIYEISYPLGKWSLRIKLPWVIWGPLSSSWCLFCAAWCRHSSRGCEWSQAWRFSSSWGAEAHRCLLGEWRRQIWLTGSWF